MRLRRGDGRVAAEMAAELRRLRLWREDGSGAAEIALRAEIVQGARRAKRQSFAQSYRRTTYENVF